MIKRFFHRLYLKDNLWLKITFLYLENYKWVAKGKKPKLSHVFGKAYIRTSHIFATYS